MHIFRHEQQQKYTDNRGREEGKREIEREREWLFQRPPPPPPQHTWLATPPSLLPPPIFCFLLFLHFHGKTKNNKSEKKKRKTHEPCFYHHPHPTPPHRLKNRSICSNSSNSASITVESKPHY